MACSQAIINIDDDCCDFFSSTTKVLAGISLFISHMARKNEHELVEFFIPFVLGLLKPVEWLMKLTDVILFSIAVLHPLIANCWSTSTLSTIMAHTLVSLCFYSGMAAWFNTKAFALMAGCASWPSTSGSAWAWSCCNAATLAELLGLKWVRSGKPFWNPFFGVWNRYP